ncbi:MAG: peptidoglycan DD-metalloendopeptidase family protein [Aureispira sp.]|nr:peptidoglycan DD-metalloendopeptidase family protein [Aureispira sp.]
MQLSHILNNHYIHPILGHSLSSENCLKLDFSVKNKVLEQLDCSNPSEFNNYIQNLLTLAHKSYGIGGYNEHRVIYQDKNLFNSTNIEERCIHLGIDIWVAAQTAIYAPLEGKIHSFQDNKGHGNYGPTIILKHQLDDFTFFSLYGHLSKKSLEPCIQNKIIRQGEDFANIGDYPENGNWAPHLHFQLILDMQGLEGDYPGVCSLKDRETMLQNCPNPQLLLA